MRRVRGTWGRACEPKRNKKNSKKATKHSKRNEKAC